MTARKPVVPPELRETIALMAQLSDHLPVPAPASAGYATEGAWKARERTELSRASLLTSRLLILTDELECVADHPGFAASLARFCERTSEAIRAELAKPLGYEPQPQADAEAGE